MNKMWRSFGFILAAHFQALTFIAFGYFAGDYLNKNHAKSFNWQSVTMSVAVLLTIYGFYVVIRKVLQLEKQRASQHEP